MGDLKNENNLNEQDNKKTKIKYITIAIVCFILGFGISAVINDSSDIVAELEESNNQKSEQLSLRDEQISVLDNKLKDAEDWLNLTPEERNLMKEEILKKKTIEFEKHQKEKEILKQEEEEKHKEEQKIKNEEEKSQYETGVTYDNISRTPKEYVGKKVKFRGKVLQVLEGDKNVQLRLAVNGDSNKVIFATYESSIVSSRVLKDDFINIMGTSTDLITYKSTMQGNITIPSMLVEKIEQ